MDLFPKPDSASSLTGQYMEALRNRFDCTILDNDEAVVLPLNVTPTAVLGLGRDLDEIFTGFSLEKAFTATRACGEAFVQSVAFGAIPDFDLALKVGLLYSRRIVLWDVLAGFCKNIIHDIQRQGFAPLRLQNSIAEHIAFLAGNLLRAKSLADLGSLVILPHPLTWSAEANQVYANASAGRLGVFWGTSAGTLLATTLSVSERLTLHPYSIDPEVSPFWLNDDLPGLVFSRQNRLVQRSFVEILETPSLNYLEEISLRNFYGLLRETPFLAEELHNLLGDLDGMTEQQWRERIQFTRGKIQTELRQSSRLEEIRRVLGMAGPLIEAAAATCGDGTAGLRVVFDLLGHFMESSAAGLEPISGRGILVGFLSRAQTLAEQDRRVAQIAQNPLSILRR